MNRTRTTLVATVTLATALALSACGANTPTAAPPIAPPSASASTDTPTVDPTVTPPLSTTDTPPVTTTTTDTPTPTVDPAAAAPPSTIDPNTPAPSTHTPAADPNAPPPITHTPAAPTVPITHTPAAPTVPVTHAPPVDPPASPPPAAPQPAPNPVQVAAPEPAPSPVPAPPVAAAPERPAPVVQAPPPPAPAPVVQVDSRSNCQRALDARPGWTSGAMASGWQLSCVDRLSIPVGGFAEGATSAGRRVIEVRQDISYQDAAYSWAHESGHAFDWAVMTPAARAYVVSQVGGDWPRGMTSSGPYLQQDQEAWGNAFAACAGFGSSTLGYKQIPCGVVARAEAIAQGR